MTLAPVHGHQCTFGGCVTVEKQKAYFWLECQLKDLNLWQGPACGDQACPGIFLKDGALFKVCSGQARTGKLDDHFGGGGGYFLLIP
jgi:hypothetical protein